LAASRFSDSGLLVFYRIWLAIVAVIGSIGGYWFWFRFSVGFGSAVFAIIAFEGISRKLGFCGSSAG
jgi:hypothetical protein